MRAVFGSIALITLALFLSAASLLPTGRDNGFHRSVPAHALLLARGADNGTPTSGVYDCSTVNAEGEEVGILDCYSSGGPTVYCVWCDGDSALGAYYGPGGTAPNALDADSVDCGGNLQVGTCEEDPDDPTEFFCDVEPSEGVKCGGSVTQYAFQTTNIPPG
jgi:hypothetical protein